MPVSTLKIDDVDEYDEIDKLGCGTSDDDWQADYLQLSPGKLKFQTRVVELPGITLLWNHFGARMRINEAYLGDTLIFCTVFPAEKPFLYRGHEFQPNHAAIQHPGSEHSYVVPEDLDSLIVHVDRSLITDAGLHLSDTVEKRVTMPALQALVNECRSTTHIIQRLPPTEDNAAMEQTLRNKILIRLLEALAPWSISHYEDKPDESQTCREFLLVKEAEKEMRKIGLATRPSIDQLAGILEVSKRTLFYAFNKWLGMGPNAYFDIMRLHYVRDQLLAGKNSTTRVTDVANELGFNHLGRFSGHYYQFFGEHPHETLDYDQG